MTCPSFASIVQPSDGIHKANEDSEGVVRSSVKMLVLRLDLGIQANVSCRSRGVANSDFFGICRIFFLNSMHRKAMVRKIVNEALGRLSEKLHYTNAVLKKQDEGRISGRFGRGCRRCCVQYWM